MSLDAVGRNKLIKIHPAALWRGAAIYSPSTAARPSWAPPETPAPPGKGVTLGAAQRLHPRHWMPSSGSACHQLGGQVAPWGCPPSQAVCVPPAFPLGAPPGNQILHTPPNTGGGVWEPPKCVPPALTGTGCPGYPAGRGSPRAGPPSRSPPACPRRWERPRPLPAPPAPGLEAAGPGRPAKAGTGASTPSPRAGPGGLGPLVRIPHPPAPPGSSLGVLCHGGVLSKGGTSGPSPTRTPPAVSGSPPGSCGEREPPRHRKSLLMNGPPPRCRGPSAAARPPNPGPGAGGFAAPRPHE